jgi:hypothetical protein
MTLLEELKNRHAELSQQLDEAREREEALHEEILDLEKAIGGLDPSFWDDAGEYDYADDDEIEAAPEPATADLFEDKPQEIEASVQSEPCVSVAVETEMPSVPGTDEESRDHSDDASEFAEDDDGSGYAPVVDPEPSPLIDAQTCEPVNPHVEPDIPALIASAEAQLTDLRIRPLGIGYFSSSPDALDLSDDAKPPHQPARSQRVQKKREKARELLAPAPPAVMEMMGEIVSEPIPQPEWNEGYAPVTNPDAEAQAKALDYYSPERVAERNRFNPFNIFKREDA